MIDLELEQEINNEEKKIFPVIVLQQSFKYFLLNNILKILFALALCFFITTESNIIRICIGAIILILIFKVTYNLFYTVNLKYTLTEQQIIINSGVFTKTTNYIELYRIYDYVCKQSLIFRLLNIMTIQLLSRDQTTPTLFIRGIENNFQLIKIIRLRVEYNKRIKSVIELNNLQL